AARLQLPQRRRRDRLWQQHLRPGRREDELRAARRAGQGRLQHGRLLPGCLPDQPGRQRAVPRADLATAPVGGRLYASRLTLLTTTAASLSERRRREVPGYGQVTSISKGLFTGCMGLAMSIPVAVPEIV